MGKIKLASLAFSVMLLCACQAALNKQLDEYEEKMAPIEALDEKFYSELERIDLKQVDDLYGNKETEVPKEDVLQIKEIIDESLIPLSEEMNEKAKKIETMNDDIKKIHNDYVESLELKETFSKELGTGIDLYIAYEETTNQLIKDSETVSAAKKERQKIIQQDHPEKASKEIDTVIDIVNEKSDELEKHIEELKGDTDAKEKEALIEDTIMMLIDEQVTKLNQLSLETDEAKSVRSISLEMFYTFKSYYKERIKIVKIYEEEENINIQNILPKVEAFEKLDDTYHDKLKELKNKDS